VPQSPRPSRQLPPSPNLEQQKKQARELLEAARSSDPEALQRFGNFHPQFAGKGEAPLAPASLALHDAQLVLAREYGFPSWPSLKAQIEARTGARHTLPFVRDLAWYNERAEGLLSVHAGGLPNALAQIREWHPRFATAADEEIQEARLTLEDARLVYAREHGFATWGEFAAHVQALASGAVEEPFMVAFEALRNRDWDRLMTTMRSHPHVARARGTNGNTLLNLGCSLLCGPVGRAIPEREIKRIFHRLLEAGADVDQPNDRGWTPLHQTAYSNQPTTAMMLIEAGAAVDPEAHGSGGTPLAVALFWGHREVAEVLARAAIIPRNLRIASGLGRGDLIRDCFDASGDLTEKAGAARGFYRPHSGFPVWRQSNDRQEILDEALVWAAKSDRVEVFQLLIDHGARIAADPYRGTPLLWAVSCHRPRAVAWLLEHGVDVNQVGTFGGPAHGEGVSGLHLAAQNNDLDMVKLLRQRGADPTITDRIYQSTPAGWAEHFGHHEVRHCLET
jgi:ankyrin repeat protein